MPIERPDWGDGQHTQTAVVPVEEKSPSEVVAEIEREYPLPAESQDGESVVSSADLEAFGPIATTLYSELPESEADALLDEFDALPLETKQWVESVVRANPHASLKRLAKLLKGQATLEHAANMRSVGWW